MTSMVTYSGLRVDPEGRQAPSLNDIAVSLGRLPRFCGHSREYYTVLAHSCVVAALLPPKYSIFGLLHDSPETCMADVPTPWKTQMARKREYMLLKRIYLRLGLELPDDEAQEAVDEADHLALVAEAHVIGHPYAEQFGEPSDDAKVLTEMYLPLSAKMTSPGYAIKFFNDIYETYRWEHDAAIGAIPTT